MINLQLRKASAVLATAVLPLLVGCTRDQLPARPMPDVPGSVEVGKSFEGRPIHTVTVGTGHETILVLATIHGNENAGTPLVHRMLDRLKAQPSVLEGRKVVIVPVTNPDGYAKNTRTNARGVDLNRNFAAKNRENTPRYGMSELSEPESRVILKLLHDLKPARIITIHQPLECVDWDGTASIPLAKHMAKYCYLPVEHVGSRPGSLGSYAGLDLKIPIITYELPRNATDLPYYELWARYGPALMASITYPHPPPQSLGDTPMTARALTWGAVGLTVVAGLSLLFAGHSAGRAGKQ